MTTADVYDDCGRPLTNAHCSSAVHGKESCAVEIKRYRMRGLRGVATKDISVVVIVVAMLLLRAEYMGVEGRSYMVECGTTHSDRMKLLSACLTNWGHVISKALPRLVSR